MSASAIEIVERFAAAFNERNVAPAVVLLAHRAHSRAAEALEAAGLA